MSKTTEEILAPQPAARPRRHACSLADPAHAGLFKGFNTEPMNQAVFAFRRYEDASLRYTGIESHDGLTHYGLYDSVVARE